MEITTGEVAAGILIAAGTGHVFSSYTELEPYEMGVITLFGGNYRTVHPGRPLFPFWPFKLWKFPTLQIPLTLDIPVNTAEGDRAAHFNDHGRRIKFDSLPKQEQGRIIADPLAHRLTVYVKSTILFEFNSEELYTFIKKFHTPEKLGEQLGQVMKFSLQGVFGQVTVGTALEHKDILSDIWGTKLREVTEKPNHKPWGITILESRIGHIELDEEIKRANLAAAMAFAEKKREVTLAEGQKAKLALIGEGQGEAYGAIGRYLESDGGKLAAGLEISKSIYQGATKAIIAPSLTGMMASGIEILDTLKSMKTV